MLSRRSDDAVQETIQERFDEIQSNISKVEAGVYNEDIPLIEMGPLVDETLAEMRKGDPSHVEAVEAYLLGERRKQTAISLTTFAVELGLTVAACFTSGVTAIVLGLLGAGLGIGTAAYEFERADDLNTTANAGLPGDNQLVDDPDAARFNYIMGWANLVLAGIDSGIVITEGASLLGKAERAVTQASADVIARMSPEQINLVSDAVRLEEVGDIASAEAIYSRLQSELGLSDAELSELKSSVSSALISDSVNNAYRTRGRLFEQPTITGDAKLPTGEGLTDKFGNITYSTAGSQTDQALALYHEQVHSFLSPKLRVLRNFRADFGMTIYSNSDLLRYLEEALAETYAQLRVNGLRGLPDGIRFPITNGYVTLERGAFEGVIGTITVGGITYGAYIMASNDAETNIEGHE